MRAFRSQGLHVDLLGEDLTSKLMEVCIALLCYILLFYFLVSISIEKQNFTTIYSCLFIHSHIFTLNVFIEKLVYDRAQ